MLNWHFKPSKAQEIPQTITRTVAHSLYGCKMVTTNKFFKSSFGSALRALIVFLEAQSQAFKKL